MVVGRKVRFWKGLLIMCEERESDMHSKIRARNVCVHGQLGM